MGSYLQHQAATETILRWYGMDNRDSLSTIFEDVDPIDLESEPDSNDEYIQEKVAGYQEFHDSALRRLHEFKGDPSLTITDLMGSYGTDEGVLNEAVHLSLKNLRAEKELLRRSAILPRGISEADKARKVKELRKNKHCEKKIIERAADLMEGLLRCHELCDVNVQEGGNEGKEIKRLASRDTYEVWLESGLWERYS